MGKISSDDHMDAMLDSIELADEGHICAGQPTSYADVATKSLGSVSLSSAWTKANGDTSGRKTTMAQQNNIALTASGTADHWAVRYTTGSTFHATTLASSQAVTSGGTATVGSYKIEVADPA